MKLMKQDINEVDIKSIITQASELLGLSFSLKNFIASNPIRGFEDFPFQQAIKNAYDLYGGNGYLPKQSFLQAYTEGQITEQNLIRSFSNNIKPIKNTLAEEYGYGNLHKILWDKLINADEEAKLDEVGPSKTNHELIKWLSAFLDTGQAVWKIPNKNRGFFFCIGQFLNNANYDSPENAILILLKKNEIDQSEWLDFIKTHLAALPGWVGFIKNDQQNITIIEYLAIRLIIADKNQEFLVNRNYKKIELFDHFLQSHIWLEAWELSYIENLTNKIKNNKTQNKQSPKAQFVFCIDVRSEPYRKVIESLGDYETFGFAGFFNLPIAMAEGNSSNAYCPILLKPNYILAKKHPKTTLVDKLKYAYFSLKKNIATAFPLVEIIGTLCALFMFISTIFPKFLHKQHKHTHIDYSNIEDQTNYAYGFLTAIGLTKNFASRVVLCGHGSSTINNPYASALDCGACGGNHGGHNAEIMACILNDEIIRKKLAEKEIFIPWSTEFIGAEHDTTTDALNLFNYKDIDLIELSKLTQRKAQEQKTKTFPDSFKNRDSDWAQLRPEWGLAKNAAFIVAPRGLTENIDLEGRCFLHSYDYQNDLEGKILTTILTAPMVVAQWINSQYYFSTVDNVVYGSGSKITHNIVGKIGVMQGNASDLMSGLPLQSIASDDQKLYHEPLRLTTIIHAPIHLVKKVIAENEILQRLFYNQWVRLIIIEPNMKFMLLNSSGGFSEL